MSIKIEICLDGIDSAVAAQAGGADRIELCDNLVQGGTTPSLGLIELVCHKIDIATMIMIRPRGGDFLYSEPEFDVMKRDIEKLNGLGVDGSTPIQKSAAMADTAGQLSELSYSELRRMQHNIETGNTDGVPRELLEG